MAKTLGERLRDARVALGLTQEEMAGRLEVTQAAISQWERDCCVPRNHVDAVEREYGVRISRADLMRGAA